MVGTPHDAPPTHAGWHSPEPPHQRSQASASPTGLLLAANRLCPARLQPQSPAGTPTASGSTPSLLLAPSTPQTPLPTGLPNTAPPPAVPRRAARSISPI